MAGIRKKIVSAMSVLIPNQRTLVTQALEVFDVKDASAA